MKPLLQQGSENTSAVRELQGYLNLVLRPSPNLVQDGDFGPMTLKAVMEFQQQAQLAIDGIVGKYTWSALFVAAEVAKKIEQERPNPQAKLADIARTYIGARETPSNLAGDDERMQEIFAADNLDGDGYPWCAAFVSLCVQKLLETSNQYAHVIPPREASVHRFLTQWAEANKCLIFRPGSSDHQPLKGDIVIYTFSHIGIVDAVDNEQVATIEGNTDTAGSREGVVVAEKTRDFDTIRVFIRLPAQA